MMRSLTIPVLFILMSSSGVVLAEDHEGLPHALEAGWKGEDVCEVLLENDEMVVGKCTFPPGVGHDKHYHNPHFGYILEGSTMQIIDENGKQARDSGTGVNWSTDSITVHEVLNVGDTTAVALIIEPKPQK